VIHDRGERFRARGLGSGPDVRQLRGGSRVDALAQRGEKLAVPAQYEQGERSRCDRPGRQQWRHRRDRLFDRGRIGDAGVSSARRAQRLAQCGHADSARRDGRHRIDAESAPDRRDIDIEAEVRRLVGHVERDDERDLHFAELKPEQERALDILCVPHQHDRALEVVQNHVASHPFVVGGGTQRIRPRRVDDRKSMAREVHVAPGQLHGGSRVI
jgi:hypothetical protein